MSDFYNEQLEEMQKEFIEEQEFLTRINENHKKEKDCSVCQKQFMLDQEGSAEDVS